MTDPTARPVDETARNARIVMMHWLLKTDLETRTKGKILLCRPHKTSPWEPCGFVADTKRQTMNFKFGNFDPTVKDTEAQRHYQPIGRDNGIEFFPDAGAKILGQYEWALGTVEVIEGPFKTEAADAETQSKLDADLKKPDFLMSEDELKKINQCFVDIQTVLMKHCELEISLKSVEDKDLTPLQQVELAELRHTIHWWSENYARLGKAIKALVDAPVPEGHQKLLPDLSNAQPKKLAESVLNFLRMALDEDALRRAVVTTKIARPETATIGELVRSGIIAVDGLLKADDNGVPQLARTVPEVEDILHNLSRVYPSVVSAMLPFDGKPASVEEVAAVRAALGTELDAVIKIERADALKAQADAIRAAEEEAAKATEAKTTAQENIQAAHDAVIANDGAGAALDKLVADGVPDGTYELQVKTPPPVDVVIDLGVQQTPPSAPDTPAAGN